jgi:hypothetical protein
MIARLPVIDPLDTLGVDDLARERMLFAPEPDVRSVITEKSVRGWEAVRKSMNEPRAALGEHEL